MLIPGQKKYLGNCKSSWPWRRLHVCLQAVIGLYSFSFSQPWAPKTGYRKKDILFFFFSSYDTNKDKYWTGWSLPGFILIVSIIVCKIQFVPGVWPHVIINVFPGVPTRVHSNNHLSISSLYKLQICSRAHWSKISMCFLWYYVRGIPKGTLHSHTWTDNMRIPEFQ